MPLLSDSEIITLIYVTIFWKKLVCKETAPLENIFDKRSFLWNTGNCHSTTSIILDFSTQTTLNSNFSGHNQAVQYRYAMKCYELTFFKTERERHQFLSSCAQVREKLKKFVSNSYTLRSFKPSVIIWIRNQNNMLTYSSGK